MRINYFTLLKRTLAACLVMISSVACGAAPMSASGAMPAPTQAPLAPNATVSASSSTTAASDEQAVRSVVEQFGQKLQTVSLQAPRALVTQEIQQQYVSFVSAELLNKWLNDPSQAPGRVVSSPWPDRIEITSMIRDSATQYTATQYTVQGNEVEMTSVELVNGGRAGQQPVRLTVEKQQRRWVITAYARTIGIPG